MLKGRDDLMERLNNLVENHREALDVANEIVHQVELDGKVTYLLAAPRKLQLLCEIAEALIDAG